MHNFFKKLMAIGLALSFASPLTFVHAENFTYPLTGMEAKSQGDINHRPLAVMIDNHPAARFQAGISQADIIYEYQVEGPYTRYMAVFHSQQPDSIGPIRSARPYFVETASDLNAIYTHFGGSGEGNQAIKDKKVNNIDGMKVPESVIWRYYDTGKVAPHNAYASYDSLLTHSQKLKYSLENTKTLDIFEFYPEFTAPDGEDASSITVSFYQENISQFDYQEDTNSYIYTKDGNHQVDEYNQKDVSPRNIIIHKMNFEPLNANSGTYSLDQAGEGTADYFTAGKHIQIKWKKETGQPYQYFNTDGQPLKLNPGMTWIAFGKENTEIQY